MRSVLADFSYNTQAETRTLWYWHIGQPSHGAISLALEFVHQLYWGHPMGFGEEANMVNLNWG